MAITFPSGFIGLLQKLSFGEKIKSLCSRIRGIIQKRVYPVAFYAKKGNVFLAVGRGAVRALNTSKTRSSASAPRPRCLGSIPDHFFSIFKSATRSNGDGRPPDPGRRPNPTTQNVQWRAFLQLCRCNQPPAVPFRRRTVLFLRC